MASISFLAGEGTAILDMGGSGLGFYGPGTFGNSVRVGEYQDNTYITDANGTAQGPKADNVKYRHPNSGEIAGGDVRNVRDIPNQLGTLGIRFQHNTPVKVQNARLRFFDRSNINLPPVGVTAKVVELIHPWNTTSPQGSGGQSWSTPGGSGGLINGRTYDNPLVMANSPGAGGWSPNGANTTDTTHDWSVAISASPDSVGSKTQFGLYFSCEYL